MARGLLRSTAGVLLAAALAACVQPPAATDGAAAGWPEHLSLTGCSAWDAYVGPLPATAAPGTAPAGWEPGPETGSYVRMTGYECERIGVGPFERGPVHIVLDGHTNARFPAACAQGERREVSSILSTLWIDDPELAAYLQGTYGLPVRLAAIAVSHQASASIPSHTGSWVDAGTGGRSEVTVLSATAPHDASPAVLFWPHGDGVASLALVLHGKAGPGDLVAPAHGTLQPPALLASLPGGRFGGQGSWAEGFDADGTFHAYRDTMCAQPEAPA